MSLTLVGSLKVEKMDEMDEATSVMVDCNHAITDHFTHWLSYRKSHDYCRNNVNTWISMVSRITTFSKITTDLYNSRKAHNHEGAVLIYRIPMYIFGFTNST